MFAHIVGSFFGSLLVRQFDSFERYSVLLPVFTRLYAFRVKHPFVS